jgi:hypothetical protein
MPVVYTPESEYKKELDRWNTPKRQGGFAPDGHEEFPLMLYKAFAYEKHGGKTMCGDPLAAVGDPDAETFSRKCQLIVRDESKRDRAMSDGWAATPTKALEVYETAQQGVARAAAEEAFRVKRMSDKAEQEFHTAQDQADGFSHVPDPAAPKRKPGRPKKVKAV